MRHLQYQLFKKGLKISIQNLNAELRKIQHSVCIDRYTGLHMKSLSALKVRRKLSIDFYQSDSLAYFMSNF